MYEFKLGPTAVKLCRNKNLQLTFDHATLDSRHHKTMSLPCPPKHLYTPQYKGYLTLQLNPSAAQ